MMSERLPRAPRRLSRRHFLKTSVTGAAVLTLAGCSQLTPSGSRAAPGSKEPRSLTVSIWGGVTEESVRKWVLPRFQKEFNATVTLDVGLQGARFNKLLSQRGAQTVDIFCSTEELVYNGLKQDLFEKIDPKKIPNMARLHPWATPVPEYGPAIGLTTFGLAYNTRALSTPPTSWADLWRPDLRGRLALINFTHSQGPALLIRAAELHNGSMQAVDAGFASLAELRPAVVELYFTEYIPQLLQDQVLVAPELDYYVQSLKLQGYPIDWVLPDDGAFSVLQIANIVKGSPNRQVAEQFIDFYLDSESQRAIANDNYTSPSNKETTLEPTVAAKTMVGDRLAKLRTFDLETIADARPAWTERFSAEVLPKWKG
ncbi:MAG: extracellular solute-binding protein [Chloroflexi bacterium]|nr:extracellular solute-binding protein [Chloroflexota bacterium]